MSELTQERLKELLHYDLETGIFIWKKRPGLIGKQKTFNVRFIGKEAGVNLNTGYLRIMVYGKCYQAHILAWFYVYGVWPKSQIDHKDNVRHHNWISNLREATNLENAQNTIKARSNNKSTGLLGAYFYKPYGKFVSRITLNGKQKHLGYFDTPEKAHQAYIKAKRELHPFGNL